MTAAGRSGETLVVRRFIPVARERVFAAWLDPESLAQWMRPRETTDATAEVDPRVGGKFRIVMAQGSKKFEHTGEYLVVDSPARLSFTWISEATYLRPTVVIIEFFEKPGGTELVLTHRQLPAPQIDSHRNGWTDIAKALDETLRSRSS